MFLYTSTLIFNVETLTSIQCEGKTPNVITIDKKPEKQSKTFVFFRKLCVVSQKRWTPEYVCKRCCAESLHPPKDFFFFFFENPKM